MSAESWAVSRDGEIYHGDYASRDEAIEAVREGDELDVAPGQTFYVGRAVPWIPTIHGSFVADRLADDTCDDVPADVVGNWPNLSRQDEDSLGADLTAALHEWLRERGKWPTFFTVTDITEHRGRVGEGAA